MEKVGNKVSTTKTPCTESREPSSSPVRTESNADQTYVKIELGDSSQFRKETGSDKFVLVLQTLLKVE